jgi:hypothetical protein
VKENKTGNAQRKPKDHEHNKNIMVAETTSLS